MNKTSDAYSCYVCNICGLFAQRLYRKESKRYITNHDIHYCQACKNYTQISKIMIPYAFKLLVQELMSLNIAPRIRVEQDIYTGRYNLFILLHNNNSHLYKHY